MNKNSTPVATKQIVLTPAQFQALHSNAMLAIGVAMENLDWVSGILHGIRKVDDREFSAIAQMTGAGKFLCDSAHNTLDCERAAVEEVVAEVMACQGGVQ